MPRTGFSPARNLEIELDSPGYTYRPGDTLKGRLHFKQLSGEQKQFVRVINFSLWGRAKTKLIRKNGRGSTIYRGRADFFDIPISLTLVGSSSTGEIYEFDTVIPTSPLELVTQGDRWKPDGPFLANTENVSKHPLPPVFYYAGKTGFSGTRKEAYIEYVLTANAVSAGSTTEKSTRSQTMTIPLMLRHEGTQSPIQHFGVTESPTLILVKSVLLLPEKTGTSLTVGDRMKTTFQRSKLPQFACQVMVRSPKFIQLGNPSLPFKVFARLHSNEQWTTIPPTDYPAIKVTAFSLKLKSETHLRCQTIFSSTDSEKSDEEVLYDSRLRSNGAAEVGVLLNVASEDVVDFGNDLGLAVYRSHASIGRKDGAGTVPGILPFHKPIHPTFKTYNVAQTHSLAWKVMVEIVGTGKKDEIEGSAPITVLSECEEFIAANEEREFDGRGVKKNYDDFRSYAVAGVGVLSRLALIA